MRKTTLLSLLVIMMGTMLALEPLKVFAVDGTSLQKGQLIMPENVEGEKTELYNEDDEGVKSTNGYYFWKVTSKTVAGHPYGNWRRGPSGRGPGTIAINNSKGYNRYVANTITGSYTNVNSIAVALGVTIGKSEERSIGYSLKVPSGKRYQILYRPQFKKYKVVETRFLRIDGSTSKTSETKISYVNVFSNWDFSWKEI